ncbi:hypothetical protein HYS00_04690 [Candidatus Microgenomates bacterium]|nr:hypothetical protein [Candidatus Microgenomates bacterium]
MVLSGRSKIITTSGIVFLAIAAVVLFIALTVARNTTQQSGGSVSREQKRNMILDQTERDKVVKDFNTRVGKTTNSVMKEDPGFTYELSPEFKNRIKEHPIDNKVLGVSTLCNLSTVPPTVYVHDLQNHLSVDDAKNLAHEYDVDSISFSLPSETTTYQYLFIRPNNTASFTQYEGSGVYAYNHASALAAGTLGADNLRRYSNQMLSQHKLDKSLGTPQYNTIGEVTKFTYHKNLPDFMLVDEASIQSFFDQENCSISDSDIMGLISVSVKNNGEILKLLNNTRTITGTYKMNTIPADVALQEYKDAQPIDPILFPANAVPDPARAFTIDSAVIAYYDVGVNFAQSLYIPLYIAHGFSKTASGQDVQILTFFPAVSANELSKKGLVREIPLPGNKSTQQQGTLPFATPTPHKPPPFSAKKAEIGVSGPGCPGNLVDYMVSCSVEGSVICRGNFTGSAAADPVKACTNGCTARVNTVDVTGGKNPCDAIMQQNGVTPDTINGEVPRQRLAPSGEVSCILTACPT